MSYYIIQGTYIPQPLFQATWKADTVEELESEIEFITERKWRVDAVVLVVEED